MNDEITREGQIVDPFELLLKRGNLPPENDLDENESTTDEKRSAVLTYRQNITNITVSIPIYTIFPFYYINLIFFLLILFFC